MTKKQYTVVGTAVNESGKMSVRYANGLENRVKVLGRNGYIDIRLVELPNSMTKMDATQYLLDNGDLNDIQRAVIEQKLIKLQEQARKEAAKDALSTGGTVVEDDTSVVPEITDVRDTDITS